MADPVNGGSGSQPPKEMSMELRLLLAFILMGVVMFVSQYYFKSAAPPAAQKAAQNSAQNPAPASPADATKDAAQPPAPPPEEAKAEAAPPAAGATPQQAQPPVTIDTDLYHVTFSNQGATVRSWQLKKFKANKQDRLELVNTASTLPWPFSLGFPDTKPAGKDVNWAFFVQTADPD